jgi:hypothetical protein
MNRRATAILGRQRYEAYTDCGGRHFVIDNKLHVTCGRCKTRAAAMKEAREMNECDRADNEDGNQYD